MTERQVKVIFGVLALLVAAYAGVQLTGGGGDGSGGALGLAAAVEGPPDVVRVYRAGGDSLRLEARRGTARVNGFPADSADLASLFAALDTAAADELVSRNPENHERLGVSSGEADSVAVGPAGSASFAFLLGGSGRGGRFVRRPGDDRAYLLEGTVASSLGRTEGRWRDLEIAALDTGRVARLAVERDGRRTLFVRDSAGWRTAGSGPLDATEASTILGELAGLRASSQLPPDSAVRSADFSDPDAALRAWSSAAGEGEPLLVLRAVERGGSGDYLARREDRPLTYPLPGYRVDRVFPTAEEENGRPGS